MPQEGKGDVVPQDSAGRAVFHYRACWASMSASGSRRSRGRMSCDVEERRELSGKSSESWALGWGWDRPIKAEIQKEHEAKREQDVSSGERWWNSSASGRWAWLLQKPFASDGFQSCCGGAQSSKLQCCKPKFLSARGLAVILFSVSSAWGLVGAQWANVMTGILKYAVLDGKGMSWQFASGFLGSSVLKNRG